MNIILDWSVLNNFVLPDNTIKIKTMIMKKYFCQIYVLLITLFLTSNVVLAQNYFEDFPVRANPKTIGDKLSKRFLETQHQLYFDKGIHYAEV